MYVRKYEYSMYIDLLFFFISHLNLYTFCFYFYYFLYCATHPTDIVSIGVKIRWKKVFFVLTHSQKQHSLIHFYILCYMQTYIYTYIAYICMHVGYFVFKLTLILKKIYIFFLAKGFSIGFFRISFFLSAFLFFFCPLVKIFSIYKIYYYTQLIVITVLFLLYFLLKFLFN